VESLEDRNDVATSGDECILIVEDDDLVREHAINLITSMGYSVRSAKSGEQALAILSDDPDINAMFSDMVMPGGMGGDRLAEIAQRERPDIKVLLTSGYTEQFFMDPGTSQRKVEILAKPYRRCDLAKRLRDVLDNQKAD
jgi:DNA-binding NtrC family response regulator